MGPKLPPALTIFQTYQARSPQRRWVALLRCARQRKLLRKAQVTPAHRQSTAARHIPGAHSRTDGFSLDSMELVGRMEPGRGVPA